METPAVILDVDGTLVDTNYHHVLAWSRALAHAGCRVPLARVHRHMGMGGDQLVAAVAGDAFEAAHGDEVRDLEAEAYATLIDEVALLPGARELLSALKGRGRRIVLASSAKQPEIEHYVELLDAADVPYTTSADVEATKPEPDLVLAALEKTGGGAAVMVGDSTWDCEAARRAGVECHGVLTGGFGADELRAAGARSVSASLEEVLAVLDREAHHAHREPVRR